jgi:hypothetical protein
MKDERKKFTSFGAFTVNTIRGRIPPTPCAIGLKDNELKKLGLTQGNHLEKVGRPPIYHFVFVFLVSYKIKNYNSKSFLLEKHVHYS